MNPLFFPAFVLLMIFVLIFLKSGIDMLRNLSQEDIWIAPIYVLIAITKIIGSLALLIVVIYEIILN